MTATRAQPGRGASPRIARAINDRLALRLLQQEGPLTAGQLKELTGMSRPSVADLVERLQDSGLIEVVGESGAARRGPNARVYGIVASRAHVAGLDVRVESIAVEIADLLGRTVARGVLPVAADADPARLLEDGVVLLEDTARAAGVTELHTVAFGAPGMVDPVTGRLSPTGALPSWHGDLVDEVRKRFGVPVLLENEVNLAAVAEQRAGAAAGPAPDGDDATFALLWLGSGVGAALVLDGRLRRGTSGGAGEVGFLPLSTSGGLPTATDCDNGFHGMAGSRAVCALAREHGLPVADAQNAQDAAAAAAAVRSAITAVGTTTAVTTVGTSGREAGDARGAGFQAQAAAAGAAEAELEASAAVSAAFLDALAARIAVGVASICAVVDPGRVVLAGEVGQAGGRVLADRVAECLARLSPLRTAVQPTAVDAAPILRGAVVTAMDAAQDTLFTPPA